MADLITRADLNLYPVEITADEEPFVAHLIEVASAAVVEAAGSPIVQSRRTVEVLAGPGKVLKLPGLPVTDIHSILLDGVDATGWIRVAQGAFRPYGWPEYVQATVDYTHGYPEVPADIGDLTARMVIAGLHAGRDDDLALNNGMLSSAGVDDYREAYATGDIEAVTEMTLPERARNRLRARFGGSATVVGSL